MVKVVKAITKEKIGFALKCESKSLLCPAVPRQRSHRRVTGSPESSQVTAQRAGLQQKHTASWVAAVSNIHVKVVATKDGTSAASPQFIITIASPLGIKPPGDRLLSSLTGDRVCQSVSLQSVTWALCGE